MPRAAASETRSDSIRFPIIVGQYNIKKKEEAPEAETQKEPDNPLMRKKKTPEELAKEAEEADQDELTSAFIMPFRFAGLVT